jgi:hypothetical protein
MSVWKKFRRLINGEIAFGFFCAGLFWLALFGWVASFTPTTQEKEACYQAAAQTGHDTSACKSFWEELRATR